ncbi:MAG: KH domain-containing protein [Candidatus Hydrogenedens sp.]|nr:KH domain-containing protein [Candidatus Hydrogenedens sp.]
MKQVEGSAPTREEAIQKALAELGAEMYEVDDIKILDEGSKGLFGFGARNARVMVTIEGRHDEPQRARKEQRETREPREQREPREKREPRQARSESQPQREERPKREEKREETAEGGEQRPRRRGQRGRRGGRGQGAAAGNTTGAAQAPADKRPAKLERTERPAREDRPQRENGEARPERPRREPRVQDERSGMETDTEAFAAISDEQGAQAASMLQEVINGMGITAEVKFVRTEDGAARLDVSSEDGAILIGRKGSTLNALQYLINRMIPAEDGESLERLMVDVEGYLDRRRESLQELALSLADKAKKGGRNMKLKPMSPQERRIVHLALQDDPDVRTFSQGESLFRAVVISPRGEGAVSTKSSSRGSRGGRGRGGRPNRPRRNESEIDVGALSD